MSLTDATIVFQPSAPAEAQTTVTQNTANVFTSGVNVATIGAKDTLTVGTTNFFDVKVTLSDAAATFTSSGFSGLVSGVSQSATITVTGSDSSTTIYKFNLTRNAAPPAPGGGGVLPSANANASFASNGTSISDNGSISVTADTIDITITPATLPITVGIPPNELIIPGATYTVTNGGSTSSSYTGVQTVTLSGLSNGPNTVTVLVTSSNGSVNKTYTFTVNATIASSGSGSTLDANNADSQGVTYSLAAGLATVSGFSGSATSVSIPSQVSKEGTSYTVTNMDISFFQSFNGTSLSLPSTISYIHPYNIGRVSNLTSLSVNSANPYFMVQDGLLYNLHTESGNNYATVWGGFNDPTISNPVTVNSVTKGDVTYPVTSIHVDQAPLMFWGATSVIFGDNVTSVGGGDAFHSNTHIVSIVIMNSDVTVNFYNIGSQFTTLTIGSGSGSPGSLDANNADSQGVTYELNSPNAGEAAVSGYSGTGGAIVIPSTVTATDSAVYSVVKINNSALSNKSITSLSFPDTLLYIGALFSCGYNLFTTLTIPSSVTFIGNSAFADCGNLESIVCNVGPSANIDSAWVNRNYNLTSITFPNNTNFVTDNSNGCNYNKKNGGTELELVWVPYNVVSLDIPSTFSNLPVKSIGTECCISHSALTSVTIPSSVTSLGQGAFASCGNLVTLNGANGLTSISNSAFSGCDSLASVTIGAAVTSIGWMAFYGCNELSRVIFLGDYDTTLNGAGIVNGYINLFYNCRFQRTGTDQNTDPSTFATLYYAEGATGWDTITVSPDTIHQYSNFPFQVPPVMLKTYTSNMTVNSGETVLVTGNNAILNSVSGTVIVAAGSTVSIPTVNANAIIETGAGSSVEINNVTSAIVIASAGSTVTMQSGSLSQVSGSGTVTKTGTGLLEIASTTSSVDYVVNDGEVKFASTVTAIGNVETADGSKATVQPAEGTTVSIASVTVGGSDGSEATLNNNGDGDVNVLSADKEKKTLNVIGGPVYINNVISVGPNGDIYVGDDIVSGNLTYTNGGDYSYDGPTQVLSGSTLTFANGNVNLTNSDVTINAYATLVLEFTSGSIVANTVKSLTLNGSLIVNISSDLAAADYTVMTGTLSALPANVTVNYTGSNGYTATLNKSGDNYVVTIADNSTPTTYTVGGSYTGLTTGAMYGLQLSINDAVVETITQPATSTDGTFEFTTLVSNGSNYSVTVSTQPDGKTGTVTNGSGTISSSNITNISIAFADNSTPPTPSSNVCFPAKTPVLTNQGPVNIEDIDPAVHTIRNKKIVAITKTVAHDKNLVRIAKHALGKNYPEKTTFISQNHKVLCQGQMIKAKHLVGENENVTFVPYNGQVLYNVLLEEHEKMQVNNLIVETLHPEHKVAKLYRFLKNVDAAHHGKLISAFNKKDKEHRQSTF